MAKYCGPNAMLLYEKEALCFFSIMAWQEQIDEEAWTKCGTLGETTGNGV